MVSVSPQIGPRPTTAAQDDGNYDVRDIAFYLKDGTVSAITMTKPYAFRFAYGVDRDAALRLAEENRSALCGQ